MSWDAPLLWLDTPPYRKARTEEQTENMIVLSFCDLNPLLILQKKKTLECGGKMKGKMLIGWKFHWQESRC